MAQTSLIASARERTGRKWKIQGIKKSWLAEKNLKKLQKKLLQKLDNIQLYIIFVLQNDQNMNKEIKEQVEQAKRELAIYLDLAKKLGFPAEEVEKQVNKYLETLQELLKKKNN